jgi:hypothetical protein
MKTIVEQLRLNKERRNKQIKLQSIINEMKKITITLSDKAFRYLNEVKYSLDKGDGHTTTPSDAINKILESSADFESVEDQSVL